MDEYQDLNRADQVLLDLLTFGDSVVIGDENQSIYRFRYAHPEGIGQFHIGHRPTHDEGLDECRRCPTRVVDLADSLIMHNHPGRNRPQLLPMEGNREGEIHIVQWRSLEEETVGIADYVQWLIEKPRGYDPGDILILSPRRHLAYKVRDSLAERNLSAHSFYHEEALEDDAAQESFAYLTLLAIPHDRVALRFLLGQGSSTWLKGEYKRLRSYCENEDLSPRQALEQIAEGKLLLHGVKKVDKRYRKIRERLNQLGEMDLRDLVDSLFPDGDEETRLLRESALSMFGDGERGDIQPDALLARLRNLITQPEMPERADFVGIMSLQKSKGLTSKVV
ncbi:MAG: UvrD-helicase domain-containing protein, partial [Candidatus Acidiferrales bacterium]